MNLIRPEESGPIKHSLALWCAQKIGLPRVWDHCEALGIFDGQDLVAAVIYHNWHPEAGVIEISAAAVSRRWLTRRVLHEVFAFPFERLAYQLVVMRVSPRNISQSGRGIQRICRSFGFEEYRIPRLRGRDEDEIIFTLTDDVWRSKKEGASHGQSPITA